MSSSTLGYPDMMRSVPSPAREPGATRGTMHGRHFRRPSERPFLASERGGTIILLGGLTRRHEQFIKAVFEGSGDACHVVLQKLAQILKSISRETDTSVRYGGEEFIIVLPNTPEEETIFLANRIRKAVQEHNFIVSATEKVNITLSGGIASYPKNAGDAKSLLNAADTALYAAKAAGKNVVICCEGDNQ